MDFTVEKFYLLLAALGLAGIATFFWLGFWFHYSEKYSTPRKLLFKALLLGVIAASFAALIERVVFIGWLPKDILNILSQERSIQSIREILLIFSIVFFFIAIPEELLKVLFFKTALFDSPQFDQVIDGMKFGLVLGLGFALVENIYIFFHHFALYLLELKNVIILFSIRLLIATLAHSLYGGILGYYFALAKFYKIFRKIFLTQGIFTVIIMHTLFNFLLLTPFYPLLSCLLIIALVVVMRWYTDRMHFQVLVNKKPLPFLSPPILAERKEMQALISIGHFNFKILAKFGLCPFCFKKIKKGEKICHYCRQPLPFLSKKEKKNNFQKF